MESIPSLVAELGPLLVSVLLLLAANVLRDIRARLEKRNAAKEETNGFVSVLEMDERIDEFITELRVKLGADRAHFSQPHNGTHFASMYPMYKLSRTHESCALGISYQRKEMSQVRVSEITYLVSPLLLGTLVEGSELFCNSANHENRVIGFAPANMGEVYERFFLESMSIHHEVATSVWVEGDLYGFIGIDFCQNGNVCVDWDSAEWRCHVTEELRKTAERIGYVIKEGKKKIKSK